MTRVLERIPHSRERNCVITSNLTISRRSKVWPVAVLAGMVIASLTAAAGAGKVETDSDQKHKNRRSESVASPASAQAGKEELITIEDQAGVEESISPAILREAQAEFAVPNPFPDVARGRDVHRKMTMEHFEWVNKERRLREFTKQLKEEQHTREHLTGEQLREQFMRELLTREQAIAPAVAPPQAPSDRNRLVAELESRSGIQLRRSDSQLPAQAHNELPSAHIGNSLIANGGGLFNLQNVVEIFPPVPPRPVVVAPELPPQFANAASNGRGVVLNAVDNAKWVGGLLYDHKGKVIITTVVLIGGAYYLLTQTEAGAATLEMLGNAKDAAYDTLAAIKEYCLGREEALGADPGALDKKTPGGETSAQNGSEAPTEDEEPGNKRPITPEISDKFTPSVEEFDVPTTDTATPVNNVDDAGGVTTQVPREPQNPSDKRSEDTGERGPADQEYAPLNAFEEEGSAPETDNQETEPPAPAQTMMLERTEAAALMLDEPPAAIIVPIRPAAGSYMSNAWAANTMFQMSLNERLGSYYQGDTVPHQGRAWIRYSGSRGHLKDTSGELRTAGDRSTVMMGVDMLVQSTSAQDQFKIGIMGGYGHYSGHTRSDGFDYSAKGKVNGYSIGLYGTYQKDVATQHGFYADISLLWNQFDNRVNGGDLPAEKYDSKGMTASLELGYNIPLVNRNDGKYVLQPHAQVMYQNVRSENFRQADGTNVDFMNHARVQATLGVRAAAHITTGLTSVITPHIEANWLHANKGYGVSMDNADATMNSGRNIGQVKLGVQGDMNRRVSLNIELFHNQGSAGYHETGGNVTAKYRF